MKTKNILCNGCSFTDPNYYKTISIAKEDDWIKNIKPWPHWLSKSLGATYENLALSGCGNDRIAYTTIEKIRKDRKKIDAVCLGLSGWDRMFPGTFDIDGRIILGSIIFKLYLRELLLGTLTFKDFDKEEYRQQHDRWAHLVRVFNNKVGVNYSLEEWPPASLEEVGISELVKQELIRQIDFELQTIGSKIGSLYFTENKLYNINKKKHRSLINNVYIDTFRNVSNVVDVCKSNNIPLVISNATGTATEVRKEEYFKEMASFVIEKNKHELPWVEAFFDTLESTEALRTILDSPEFNYLEEIDSEDNNVKLVGWPWAYELGGECSEAVIRANLPRKFDTREEFYDYTKISKSDRHWNETGHKLVSEYVYYPHLKDMI